MDNIIDLNFPKAKTVSPVSLKQPRVGNVPSDNFLNRNTNFGISPEHNVPILPEMYSTLPPSPKNNIDNNPACSKKCSRFPDRPFKRNTCYMLYSPSQNTFGPVCGDGGSNANWVRGNRFGDSYEYSKVFNRDPWNVNVPKFLKQNPTIISDSPFYKFPDYDIRFDKNYKSYPYVNNFMDSVKLGEGRPVYTYPYDVVKEQGQGQENFENSGDSTTSTKELIVGAVVILSAICVLRNVL